MHIPYPHQNRSELNHLNSGGEDSLIEIPAGADFINQGSPNNKFGNGADTFSLNNSSGYSDQFTNIQDKDTKLYRDLTRVVQNLSDKERKLQEV
jgi:hypothetical protein